MEEAEQADRTEQSLIYYEVEINTLNCKLSNMKLKIPIPSMMSPIMS